MLNIMEDITTFKSIQKTIATYKIIMNIVL